MFAPPPRQTAAIRPANTT
jgi:hypothetical protein